MLPGIAAVPLGRSPNAPVITGVSPNDRNSSAVTVSGAADAGASIVLYRDGTSVGTATADQTTGAWSIASVTLNVGRNSLTASATIGSRTSTVSAAFDAKYFPTANTYRTNTFQASVAASYTFTAQDIGMADTSRLVVVAIVNFGNSNNGQTPTSVTIGGVTATQAVGIVDDPTNKFSFASIWYAAVPSGATGNIVVSYGAAQQKACCIAVYALYALNSNTPAVGSGNVTGTLVHADVNTQNNGFVIAMGASVLSGTISLASGVTQSFAPVYALQTSFKFYYDAGLATGVPAASPRAVTMSANASAALALVSAAWS